jgi:hypothetical protein
MPDLDPEPLTLRDAAQARDDFAQVMDELEFVKELIARLPTPRDQAFVPLKIMFRVASDRRRACHSLVGGVLAALPVKNPSSLINRGCMHKTLMATIVTLISTPALANSGHILQVHHGADCVEFALVEDANTTCGPNVYIGERRTV